MLLLIATGYGITKAGMLSSKTRVDLTNIVIYIIMPCNIFSAFHKGITPEILLQCLLVFMAATGLQVLVFVLNKLLYIKIEPQRRVVLQYATIVNNAAFIGLPVIGAVYGPLGVLYGSIMLIPMRVVMWTQGLALFTKMDKKESVKVIVTHPCIWAVFLGLGYIFVPFELPEFLSGAIKLAGDCATVLPMFVVGSILHGVKLKEVLNKASFYYSFFRLAFIPAVMFSVLKLLQVPPMVLSVAVLSSAMPAAVTTAMLAEKYGQDSAFSSKLVFISTILSMITLPVITLLLQRFSPV